MRVGHPRYLLAHLHHLHLHRPTKMSCTLEASRDLSLLTKVAYPGHLESDL